MDFSELQESWVINSGDYILVAENSVGTLKLNNGQEVLFLKDSQGTIIHRVTIEDSKSGVSKINNGEHTGDDLFVDSEAPTHRKDNTVDPINYSGASDLLFTRIMPVGVSGHEADWLEIQNVGDSAIDLSGWSISRNRSFTPPWTSLGVDISRHIDIPWRTDRTHVEPSSLPSWLSDRIVDGEVAMDTMPELIDSGTALQLISPSGTVVDTLVYDGGNAEISEWNGPSVSVRGERERGTSADEGGMVARDLPDTNSADDWEVRTFGVGASLFCAESPVTPEATAGAWASIGPRGTLGDLMGWIDGSEASFAHTHMRIFEPGCYSCHTAGDSEESM